MKYSQRLWRRVIVIQSSLAMLGSLYYSTFGDPVYNIAMGYGLFPTFVGAGLTPCLLCWFARILMYPLVWFGIYGLCSHDRGLARPILRVSIVGVALELYHYAIQMIGGESSGFCQIGVSCTDMTVAYWGFVSIPLLCLVAFSVIAYASWKIIHTRG